MESAPRGRLVTRLGAVAASAIVAWTCGGTPATEPGVAIGIPTRSSPAQGSALDVDGDGSVGSHTDALLIFRYTSGFRGGALTDEAVSESCVRCSAPEIEAYIESL